MTGNIRAVKELLYFTRTGPWLNQACYGRLKTLDSHGPPLLHLLWKGPGWLSQFQAGWSFPSGTGSTPPYERRTTKCTDVKRFICPVRSCYKTSKNTQTGLVSHSSNRKRFLWPTKTGADINRGYWLMTASIVTTSESKLLWKVLTCFYSPLLFEERLP